MSNLQKLKEEFEAHQFLKLYKANIERTKNQPFRYRKITGKQQILCSWCCELWMIGEGKPDKAIAIYHMKDKESGKIEVFPLCDEHDDSDLLGYDFAGEYYPIEVFEHSDDSCLGFDD